jgi:hypothetical protein
MISTLVLELWSVFKHWWSYPKWVANRKDSHEAIP